MEITMIDDTDDVAFTEDAITEEEAKESQADLMEAMNG